MIFCTSGQVKTWYWESGVLIMAMSFALRAARKGGHCASRRGSGTLICQNGRGVVLPMVDSVEENIRGLSRLLGMILSRLLERFWPLCHVRLNMVTWSRL